MEKSIAFFVPVPPYPWKVIALPLGRNAKSATHGKTKTFQRHFKNHAVLYRPKNVPTGPVSLSMVFYMPRTKKKIPADAKFIKKPDLTNLFKAVEDAMTGSFFKDDCQVIHSSAEKMYAPSAREVGISVMLKYY